MSTLLYLHPEGRGYRAGVKHCTRGQASRLIGENKFAAVSRFDSSIVASDDRTKVTPFGEPLDAEELAWQIYEPDWYCIDCGCDGLNGESCHCDCLDAIGEEAHR